MLEQMESVGLAEKLVETLRAQKEQGNYPLTLKKLGELANPQADDKTLLKTAAQESFSSAAVVAQKKNVEAPVVLREDLATLAGSPLLLEFALKEVCSPTEPTWSPAKLAKK